MTVFLRDHEKVLFIHIPKTGGSSLETMLTDAGWRCLDKVKGLHAEQVNFYKCTPQHWHAPLLQEVFRLDRFDKIATLVRDPFERIESEYYWQQKQAMADAPPEKWFDAVMSAYAADPFAFDNHLRPQHEFFAGIPRVQWFRLEHDGLPQTFAALTDEPPPADRPRLKLSERKPQIEADFEKLRPRIMAAYKADYDVLGY